MPPKKQESVMLEFDTKVYILTTRDNFLKVLGGFNRDPVTAMEQVGVTIGFRSGQKEKMERELKEELKKKNNPIELE